VNRRLDAPVFVCLALLPAAAAARLWGLGFCLPHPHCRPDEDAVSAIAGGFLAGDFNPHVFNYPALFMLAVAAAVWMLPGAERLLHKVTPFHFDPLLDGVSTTSKHYMVARFLSAASGVASVWLIYRIATRLFGAAAAIAAAALLALAFLHVRDSHYGVTDVAMAFMVLVAFLAAVRLSQSGSRTDLAIAGVTAGLATSTKYNAALVALPALFAILAGMPETKSNRARVADAGTFVALMILAFLCTSPYSLLDFRHFRADVMSDALHLTQGHGIDLGRGWIYHATTTLRYGLGIPILAAGVGGMVLLITRNTRLGAFVALFPVSYYVVLGSGYTVFTRHMIPIVPFLCLTAGYFVAESAAWAAIRLRRPQLKPALAALAVAGVAWPSVQSVITFDMFIARTDNRLLARQWVEARFPEGTMIAQIGREGGHVFLRDANEVPYALIPFTTDGIRPDLVIVQSAPSLDAPELGDLKEVLRTEYTLRYASDVIADDPRNVYDLQDEFYLPLAGFYSVERPGPNLKIYVRTTAAARR
jgi:hypothetical protein